MEPHELGDRHVVRRGGQVVALLVVGAPPDRDRALRDMRSAHRRIRMAGEAEDVLVTVRMAATQAEDHARAACLRAMQRSVRADTV